MKKLKFIFYIITVVAVAFFYTRFIGQRATVVGSSMEPTLHDKDQLYVEKLITKIKGPDRYDIVIFHPTKEQTYVKRIIGMPGEKVHIHDGYVYVDGKKIEKYSKAEEAGLASSPVMLTKDEYFLLGDNRNNSQDSRYIGPVKKKQIIGHAVFRIWPWKDKKLL